MTIHPGERAARKDAGGICCLSRQILCGAGVGLVLSFEGFLEKQCLGMRILAIMPNEQQRTV